MPAVFLLWQGAFEGVVWMAIVAGLSAREVAQLAELLAKLLRRNG